MQSSMCTRTRTKSERAKPPEMGRALRYHTRTYLDEDTDRGGTEMALHVLAYILKRVMNIMGIVPLIEAMSAA